MTDLPTHHEQGREWVTKSTLVTAVAESSGISEATAAECVERMLPFIVHTDDTDHSETLICPIDATEWVPRTGTAQP